ncbi:MAG: TonB-dependent receptor [Gammaproteobacteria bacterium]|nr:TonB-dependent receptor [Gammaproteobacteria bacterium]
MNQKTANANLFRPQRTAVSAAVTAALVTATLCSPASAQVLDEIIVTATKRDESVQDVPLAITALSGDFTRSVNLNDVKDLISFTPGVTGNSQDSFIDAVSVRGIRTQDFGVGGDPSAAIFKNDLYEGRNGSAVTSLYDIDRAEILRGPQGFLFGRNSIGGAINVYTRQAEVNGGTSGYIELDVAERGHFVFEGAVNIPVSDTFAMRLAGYSSQEDGFVNNLFDGNDLIEHSKQAVRWSTTFENERLTVNTQVEYETREQSGTVYRAIAEGAIWENLLDVFGNGITPQGSKRDADSDQSLGDNDNADILTLGLRVEYDMDWATLTSNTGFKDHEFFYTEDYDGTPLRISDYLQDQKGDYFQQEMRLTSNGDGPFSWYAGASYYKENIDTLFTLSGDEDVFCNYYGNYYYPGNGISDCASLYAYYGSPFTPSSDGLLTEPGRVVGEFTGWAAYVDMNYEVTEQFDIGLGIRYTDDKKNFNLNVPAPESQFGPVFAYGFTTDGDIRSSKSWDDTQVRVVGRYRVDDDNLFFASYTEGFKSGGFGSFALVDANGDRIGCCTTDVTQASGARSKTFNPETVDSYELGYKGTVFNGTTNIDLSAFIYDYKDLQISFFDGDSGANTVENVGQVDGKGLEGSVTSRLSDNWNFYAALSWLDTQAKGVQQVCDGDTADSCEGSSLFWAPEWSGAAVLSADFPYGNGAITGSVEAFWESERGGGWAGLPETMIDSNMLVAVRAGYYADSGWSSSVYVENLTNEFTYDGMNNNGGILPSHFFGPQRPRTYGIRFSYEWE